MSKIEFKNGSSIESIITSEAIRSFRSKNIYFPFDKKHFKWWQRIYLWIYSKVIK